MMRILFTGPGNRNELGRALMLGINFAVGMAVFSFAGYYIDRKRGDDAIFFSICGILLGLAYGAYEVWIVIRMLHEQARKATQAGPRDQQEGDGV